MFGLEVKVYMVRASYDQKPYRRILMETYGAEVVASPSLTTNYGRSVLGRDARTARARSGMAISEAVEDAATRDDTKYALGSVLNHVLLHQTVIGQEAIEQMGMAGESPDVVIGCAGGGSNFAGLTFPFLGRNFREGAKHRIIAVEPEAAPSLTRGVYAYDFGDTGKMAPIVKMHTLGPDFIPEPIHAGGLRYHGMAPLVSLLKEHGYIEARSVHQRASFEAGVPFARAEGILPAPEPTHAIRVAIDEALAAKEAGEAKVILFNLCGHGHFDLVRLRALPVGRPRGLRVPAREGRGRAGLAPGGLDAQAGLSRVRSADLHTVPLESLFAEERRCPRCGALLNDERRDAERRLTNRRQNPPDDPGPPEPDAERRSTTAAAAADAVAVRPADRCPATTLAGSTDPAGTSAVRRVRVAFLGFGLIAGSIARALRLAEPHGRDLVGWSPTGGGPARALADGVLDQVAATGPDALAGAELVVLAAPASDCLDLLDAAGRAVVRVAGRGCGRDGRGEHERAARRARATHIGCGTSVATRWPAGMRPATVRRPRTCSQDGPGCSCRARRRARPMWPPSPRWRRPAAPGRS